MDVRASSCALLVAVAVLGPAGSALAEGSEACARGLLEPTPDNVADVAAGLLCEMNARRAAEGLAPLRANVHLTSSAAFHARDMADNRYFAHRREPDGPTLLARIRATGYFDGVAGGLYTENLADAPHGRAAPASVVAAWMESEYHRVNMLTAPFRAAGIAVEFVPPDPAFYTDLPSVLYVVDYGRRYWRRPSPTCRRERGGTRRSRNVCTTRSRSVA